MIFGVSQHAFMMGIAVSSQKMVQVHVLSTLGMFVGALLLPLLLPLGNVRGTGANQGFTANQGVKFSRYSLRLAIAGTLFLPNIIIRLLGPEAWLAHSFYSGCMAMSNGMAAALICGCLFTQTGKYRVFWAALALGISHFVYHLALGPGRELLLPSMFAFAGAALTAAGILLLVFLSGVERQRSSQDEGTPYQSGSVVYSMGGGG
jgi:NADH:ubiquinone oxidoreductase subunit 3 (subunit A)